MYQLHKSLMAKREMYFDFKSWGNNMYQLHKQLMKKPETRFKSRKYWALKVNISASK